MKFPLPLLQSCWIIAGPTASGKSALGIALAERIGGEVVSLDSMAIFREMDIGTAKPTLAEQQNIPHHLIDIVDPHEDFSTAQYLNCAIEVAQQIVERGHVPIFVGGTGLYLRAMLRGVFEGPPADWAYRQQLTEAASTQESDWLHRQLLQVDPVSAARLHPHDTRRLVRALEIQHITGEPASRLQQETPLPPEERPQHVYWLHPDRDWLYARINQRVDEMLQQGFEEEVCTLQRRQPPLSRTARQALGYRELLDWMDGNIPDRETAIELIKTRTRQFAKRQHTWFRNLVECQEIPLTSTPPLDTIINNWKI